MRGLLLQTFLGGRLGGTAGGQGAPLHVLLDSDGGPGRCHFSIHRACLISHLQPLPAHDRPPRLQMDRPVWPSL